MAQRKSPGSSTSRPAKATASKSGPAKSGPAKTAAKRPPAKSKSIVNQKQTPWGLIVTTIVIVLFAGAVIGIAIAAGGKKGNGTSSSNPWDMPEVADAKAISGLVFHPEPNHNHVFNKVTYDTSPPTGGNHSQVWADCTGTVYPNAIANENAVHMLEHGAVWITYQPGLPAAQVATLAKLVTGIDRMAMSPYPGLKTPISLQAWGYQLFVNDASDPRIQQFIDALRFNPKSTPEPAATCSDPAFKANPSTFGNPTFQ